MLVESLNVTKTVIKQKPHLPKTDVLQQKLIKQ